MALKIPHKLHTPKIKISNLSYNLEIDLLKYLIETLLNNNIVGKKNSNMDIS